MEGGVSMEILWVTYHYVLAILLLPLVGWLLWRWNEIWYVYPVKARCSMHIKIPPGTMGLPLLGEYLTFLWYFKILRRPDDFISSKRHKYGSDAGVYRSHLHGEPTIIVSSASLSKLVLHSSDHFKHQWPTTQVLGPNSVISLHGDQHSTIKGFIRNAVSHPNALARSVLDIQPIIATALESWSQLPKIEARTEVKKVSFDVIGTYFANIKFGPRKDAFIKCLSETVEGVRSQPWNFPGMTYYRALKYRKKGTEMLREELEKRKQKIVETSMDEEINDVMDGLMQMKDKEGKYLTDGQVLDNVFNTIEAGCLGLAPVVNWSLYHLAKSPHVLQRLREENMGINKEKNGGYITYEQVVKLTYTNKVVDEIVRVGNIVPFIFWKATDDIEYEGYIIPKGWQVMLWLRNLHVDPINYEDPLSFNPDRWDERPRYGTYLPFGGGPRVCPGNTFARVGLAVFLHYLSVGYKWELLSSDVTFKYLPLAEPDCLEISLNKL